MSNISFRPPRQESAVSSDGAKEIKNNINKLKIRRNDAKRKEEIETSTKDDVKVEIPNRVKEFSRIKTAVERASDFNQSEKIAKLKQQIQNGAYDINYEELAEKILLSEL